MSRRSSGFDFSLLNPQQREAVRHGEGPLLILAGAGTGKTRVLTARIARLVADGVSPGQILAVTFTNKAAREMRERVTGMLPRGQGKDLWLGTFHSFCVRLLRESIHLLGYKGNFTIYSQGEQVGLMRRILTRIRARDEKLEPEAALGLISKARNTGVPLEDIAGELVQTAAKLYAGELRLLNAVDFDDLLVLAVRILHDHPDVATSWHQRLEHVLVDEFQDTNRLQMELVRHLVGPPYNVAVVGDDDQSIYGWRGAESANILHFERFFPDPTIVKLEENYRSTTPILHTANSLIRHNIGRRPKSLWSRNAGADPVRIVMSPDDKAEAAMIAGEILRDQHGGAPWEDYAVLFRTNAQSRLIEQEFRRQRIPYRIIGGRSFYDRREVRDVLAYLTVLANPDDDVNLLRILNTPPRGIGQTTIKLAIEASQANTTPVSVTLASPGFQKQLSSKAGGAVTSFLDWLAGIRAEALLPSASIGQVTERLVKEIDYISFIRRTCSEPEDALNRETNVREVIQSMFEFEGKRGKAGLQAFLDQTALATDKQDDDDLEKKGGVTLITLHASKGLEFPCVYLIGVEEGILPHSRSIEENSREEERRLLYVGITRAMRRMTMTWCNARMRYGEKFPCRRSSFLEELSRDHVIEVDYGVERTKPMSSEDKAAVFSRMRRMLEAGG